MLSMFPDFIDTDMKQSPTCIISWGESKLQDNIYN